MWLKFSSQCFRVIGKVSAVFIYATTWNVITLLKFVSALWNFRGRSGFLTNSCKRLLVFFFPVLLYLLSTKFFSYCICTVTEIIFKTLELLFKYFLVRICSFLIASNYISNIPCLLSKLFWEVVSQAWT